MKTTTFWVFWKQEGVSRSLDFAAIPESGITLEEAESRARYLVTGLRRDRGVEGVRLERHDPDPHTDRPAVSPLWPEPKG